MTPDHIAGLLGPVMVDALGQDVGIADVTRLKGGYSRRMWAFDAVADGGALTPWILCTDAPDGVVGADSLSRSAEAALLRYMHRAGLPVPAVATAGAGSAPFDAPWFVMARLPGTAAVGPLVRHPHLVERHTDIAQQKANILAGIHGLDAPADVFGDLPDPDDVARLETQRWERAQAQTPAADTPTTTAAFTQLNHYKPAPPERIVVVHGDYRTGNLLYDPIGTAGITAVLDWEMAHAGDPLEDVAWAMLAAWRVGTGRVGALVDEAGWVAAYEAASRRSIDREALRFWRVLTGVKMSLLAWRAVEVTPAGKEHDLLRALFDQLQAELAVNLG